MQARAVWPGIERGFIHEDLPKHLFTAAALHARRALAAAEGQLDKLDRATSVGTAVELLAKAALALISPTLIAEKDPKSSLLYSGIPAIPAHEAKSKTVVDCLVILKHSHSIDFNTQADQKIFSVRNFALHMGQVDPTIFQEALNGMTRINEAILDVISVYDATLDRNSFWGTDLLAQVDERLKNVQQARMLELEELKAAARRTYERLKLMGLDDEVLDQLAERDPEIEDEAIYSTRSYSPERHECPVCGWYGWLGSEVVNRGPVYTELDYHDDPAHLVEMQVQGVEFVCNVCGLHLYSGLLGLVGMDQIRVIEDAADREEIEALEQYQINRYLEEEYYRTHDIIK